MSLLAQAIAAICTMCKVNASREGQRNCGSCHRAYQKKWRADRKAKLEAEREELKRLRAAAPRERRARI